MKLQFVVFLLLSLYSLATFADENCRPPADLGSLFDAFKFSMVSPKFKAAPYTDLCNPKVVTTKTYQALSFLRGLKSLPRLNKKMDLNIFGEDPFAYFQSQVDTIVLMPTGGGFCTSKTLASGLRLDTHAYVSPGIRTTTICEGAGERDVEGLAGDLLHEARHVKGYPHVNCLQGVLKGAKESCDSSYQSKGSYSLSAEFALRLSKHPLLDPILQRSSRFQGLRLLVENFNQDPVSSSLSLLMMDLNGHLVTYSHPKTSQATFQLGPTEVLVDRDAENIVFDFENKRARTHLYSGWTWALGKFAEKVRSGAFSGVVKGQVQSLVYGEASVLILNNQNLILSVSNRGEKSIRIEGLEPETLIFDGWKILAPQASYYLVSKSGDLYPVPEDIDGFANLDFKRVKPVKSRFSIRQIMSEKGATWAFLLDFEGRVLEGAKEKDQWKWKESPDFKGQRFRFLSTVRTSNFNWDEI